MAYFGCINKSASPPTPPEPNYLYKWDFTKSLVDEIEGNSFILENGATQTQDGIYINNKYQKAHCENIGDLRGKTIEIKMGIVDFKSTISSTDIGFIVTPLSVNDGSRNARMLSPLYYRGNDGFGLYGSDYYDSQSNIGWKMYTKTGNLQGTTADVFNYFSNKTIKIITSVDGKRTTLYVNDVLEGVLTGKYAVNNSQILAFNNGARINQTTFEEARFYDMTIKAVKIYENE